MGWGKNNNNLCKDETNLLRRNLSGLGNGEGRIAIPRPIICNKIRVISSGHHHHHHLRHHHHHHHHHLHQSKRKLFSSRLNLNNPGKQIDLCCDSVALLPSFSLDLANSCGYCQVWAWSQSWSSPKIVMLCAFRNLNRSP